MKAFELMAYAGPDGLTLVDAPAPEPSDCELLLDVHAIGVNFPDLLMTRGEYQFKPKLPTIPGCEVAGVVARAPEGSGWRIGDRAAAFIWHGGYAEQVAVSLHAVTSVPDRVELTTASGMVVNYQTVLFALQRRGQAKRGDHVLVMGAAGGIGTAALQVARGLGARVLAGVADDNQAETARAAGATETIVLRTGFAATVREMTEGRGVDVVLDPLGDWLFDEAVRALAPEGRVIVVGFAAGEIPSIKVNRLLLRNAGVIGAAFGAFLDVDPGIMQRQAESLHSMISAGAINPRIDAVYEFHELPETLRRLGRGEIRGKAVVRLR